MAGGICAADHEPSGFCRLASQFNPRVCAKRASLRSDGSSWPVTAWAELRRSADLPESGVGGVIGAAPAVKAAQAKHVANKDVIFAVFMCSFSLCEPKIAHMPLGSNELYRTNAGHCEKVRKRSAMVMSCRWRRVRRTENRTYRLGKRLRALWPFFCRCVFSCVLSCGSASESVIHPRWTIGSPLAVR